MSDEDKSPVELLREAQAAVARRALELAAKGREVKPDDIPRTKPKTDWSVEEILEFDKTGKEPESEEWRAYSKEIKRLTGLDQEPDPDKPLDGDSSVEQHLAQMRANDPTKE